MDVNLIEMGESNIPGFLYFECSRKWISD